MRPASLLNMLTEGSKKGGCQTGERKFIVFSYSNSFSHEIKYFIHIRYHLEVFLFLFHPSVGPMI